MVGVLQALAYFAFVFLIGALALRCARTPLHSCPHSGYVGALRLVDSLDGAARPGRTGDQDTGWWQFSLSAAMRGMENEPSPYTTDDLKERFS